MVGAPVSHFVDDDYKSFELLSVFGLLFQSFYYLRPDLTPVR